jgi:hypothetical protein
MPALPLHQKENGNADLSSQFLLTYNYSFHNVLR